MVFTSQRGDSGTKNNPGISIAQGNIPAMHHGKTKVSAETAY